MAFRRTRPSAMIVIELRCLAVCHDAAAKLTWEASCSKHAGARRLFVGIPSLLFFRRFPLLDVIGKETE